MFLKINNIKIGVSVLLINSLFIQLSFSEGNNNMKLKGVIQSAKSVYVVTEPKSRTILVEAKKSSNSHVPFSFLSKLNPKNWSDYKTIIDSYSRILTDVKVKLDDGSIKVIPNLMLRQTDFLKDDPTDEEQMKEYIIDGSPGKKYSRGRYKINTTLSFFTEPETLSRYTLNEKDLIKVTIGHVEITRYDGIKQKDGSFKYSTEGDYSGFLRYGILSTDTHFDESEDKIKYSNTN